MPKFIGRLFNVYKNEVSLLVWTALLLFLLRTCGIYLNNFAETAFLKRYGVEYLPIVNMANAVATFFIMGAMTGIIARQPGARLLTRLFVFCGVSVAALRFIIPLGIDLVYPLLFMLKSQYEVLLALLFWNLANDLFNTRQSKRLFPLLTAGGIVGQILASFSTPLLVKVFSIDNFLLIYLIITLAGAVVVYQMRRRFPTLLASQKKSPSIGTKKKSKDNMITEIKKIVPMVKSSPLIMLMILLTFIPNVVIPIMNYQFNFAVNDQFGSEQALIQFFGYFRGVLNIVSLVILLFVGRIYGRWGLPVALMFHPFNYLLVFMAFLFRFDAISAIYARMSSNVIRSTINIPAMAVVTGLFPESYRNMVRPFLRGTVVRVALFLGSGMILISTNLFHPRYLSLVALPFVIGWVIVPFILKRRYARILLDLISQDTFDLKSFDPKEIQQLFSDKSIRRQLIHAFSTSKGEDSLWYARLLRSLQLPDLDTHLLAKIEGETDTKTQIGLLDYLSTAAAKLNLELFERMAVSASPDVLTAMVRTAGRIAPEVLSDFISRQFNNSESPQAKGYAAAALYSRNPDRYHHTILTWLESATDDQRLAGVIAACRSDQESFIDRLKSVLTNEDNELIISETLSSLSRLKASGLNDILVPFLAHRSPSVRLAALTAFEINNADNRKEILALLADQSEEIVALSKEKIIQAKYQNDQQLLEALVVPQKRVREGLFDLIGKMEIKDFDTVQFTRNQLEQSYRHLAEAMAVNSLPQSEIQALLHSHLLEKHRLPLNNALRILSILDRDGQIKTIHRGLNSSDSHQRGNSVEALESLLEKQLANMLIPLVEDLEPSRRLEAGQKIFDLPSFGGTPQTLINHLLAQKDWVTQTLVNTLVNRLSADQIDKTGLAQVLFIQPHDNLAQQASSVPNKDGKEVLTMTQLMTIPDKIIELRKVEILKDLDVSELAAIAAIAEEEVYDPDAIVIEEGEMSQVLYLVTEGETAVIKNQGTDSEMELARIKGNDYFGEMALLEKGRPRSATIRTIVKSRFLSLQKEELDEIINEYPKIALNFCRVLTRRLRLLDEKVGELKCAPAKDE